ncbi:MAG TPA: hypothetical protein DCP90_07015 [Clostridiales bacterium]|nr:MAG: hypothetical protein A2Y22_02295 [Clostridiales bacterium GWD2_32_59]HAN10346.1 hypothetical protein [Clostridiales bacterium]
MKLNLKFNKKYVLIIVGVLVVIIGGAATCFILTRPASTPVQANGRWQTNSSNMPNRGGMMPDENTNRIYGKVTKIVGNELTIAIAENPMQNRQNEVAQNNSGMNGSNNTTRRSSQMQEFGAGGGFGGGFSGGGMNSGNGSKRLGMTATELKLTGETANVTIPVGLEITKMGMRSQNGTSNTSQLSDITTDTVITVFVDKDDTAESKTAKRVMIR